MIVFDRQMPASSRNQEVVLLFSRFALLFLIAVALGAPTGVAAQQSGAAAAATQDDYALGPGDKVKIIVFSEPNLSGEFGISDTGQIAFPLIGGVDVNGRSVRDAAETIRARLADGYVNAPQVSLEVVKYRPYYIYGEVARSGEYPFASGLTVQQAIAAAGGYSYRAAKRHVFLRRGGEAAEARLDFKRNPTIFIRPGDTLRIGERHF